MINIIFSIVILGVLGVLFGLGLAIASKKLFVKTNPVIEKIIDILPNANCGACGFAGCSQFAEAIVKGEAEVTYCIPGGENVSKQIASILGVKSGKKEKLTARHKCRGTDEYCKNKYQYQGIKSCAAVKLLPSGYRNCEYGCLMFGDCFKACKFDAIDFKSGSLPVINSNCVGCGACVTACPLDIMELVSVNNNVFVACKNADKGRESKNKCEVACFACGICAKKCPVDAIELKNNLPVIDYNKCINCGICSESCPVKKEKAITDELAPRKKLIITDDCKGCTLCAKKCPVKAISGDVKKKHTIDTDKCVSCQLCYNLCKFNAIEIIDK